MSVEFADFYKATAPRTLTTVCRTAGNRDVAEEATQEAYAVMFSKWPERLHYEEDVNRRYVIGIAAHKVLDWYRRAGRYQSLAEDHDWPATYDSYNYLLLLKAVRQVLEDCSVMSRTVGILYFLEDFTQHELADALRIAPSTVRTHLQRLRERLRPIAEHRDWLDERRARDE